MIELVVNIAKHNNKHSYCDRYMRVFAKTLIKEHPMMAKKLEVLLNTEIAIKKPVEAEKEWDKIGEQPLHPNILAQGEFPFLSLGQKMDRVNGYRKLKSEWKKSSMMRDMLTHSDSVKQSQMVMQFSAIDKMLSQIDGIDYELDPNEIVAFERLKKTAFMVQEQV